MIQFQPIIHALRIICTAQQTCSNLTFAPDMVMGPCLAIGSRDQRRFNEDQWPFANTPSVANVAASLGSTNAQIGEMHLPEFWVQRKGAPHRTRCARLKRAITRCAVADASAG
jgi:hypothetical protein